LTTFGDTIPDVEVGYLVRAVEEAPKEEVEKTKVASGGKKRRADDGFEESTRLEMKRLEVEEERLVVEKRRLAVEEERLKLEQEKLLRLKSLETTVSLGDE